MKRTTLCILCFLSTLVLYGQTSITTEDRIQEHDRMFTLYPNQVIDNFRINLKPFYSEAITLSITDTEGNSIYKKELSKVLHTHLSMSAYTLGLTAGEYVVEIVCDNKRYIQKFTHL